MVCDFFPRALPPSLSLLYMRQPMTWGQFITHHKDVKPKPSATSKIPIAAVPPRKASADSEDFDDDEVKALFRAYEVGCMTEIPSQCTEVLSDDSRTTNTNSWYIVRGLFMPTFRAVLTHAALCSRPLLHRRVVAFAKVQPHDVHCLFRSVAQVVCRGVYVWIGLATSCKCRPFNVGSELIGSSTKRRHRILFASVSE